MKVNDSINFVDTNKFYHLGDLANELYDQLKSGNLKLIKENDK